jgi:hypothetical protein
MSRLARAISIPGEINTFPLGESADVSAIAPILNQLFAELKNLRAKVARLEQTCATLSRGQIESGLKIVTLDSGKDQISNIVASGSGQDIVTSEIANKIATVEQRIVVLETSHDQDIERLALEAAHDRQRVTKLEQHVQPLQRDRGEILRALIAASGGKLLAKYARLKMHLDKATFSRLLNTIPDHVARKVHQLDRRQKLLVLVS